MRVMELPILHLIGFLAAGYVAYAGSSVWVSIAGVVCLAANGYGLWRALTARW